MSRDNMQTKREIPAVKQSELPIKLSGSYSIVTDRQLIDLQNEWEHDEVSNWKPSATGASKTEWQNCPTRKLGKATPCQSFEVPGRALPIAKPVEYPKRRQTIMGLPAFKGAERKAISDAMINPCMALKYKCILTTKAGMMIDAVVVTHCELSDWCDLKNFDLFSIEAPIELALPYERTHIG